MPSGVNPQPALAAAIVVALLAGIAVAVLRPGDLGGDGGLDASGPTTTTTAPAGAPAPEPEGTEAPGTTVAVPGTPSTAGPATPTTTSPSLSGSPTPTTTPTGDSQPPGTLADTGGSAPLAPLAAVLLLAVSVGRQALRSRPAEPAT